MIVQASHLRCATTIILSLATLGRTAVAEGDCLAFEIIRETSTADDPSEFVEKLAISQVDIRSAAFGVWEPSEETQRYFEGIGRPVPLPRPQITVEVSERASAELERATAQYHGSSAHHHIRIVRVGFEPFQARIAIPVKGASFIVPVEGRDAAEQRIPMFTRPCE